jgi:hypothetical protein
MSAAKEKALAAIGRAASSAADVNGNTLEAECLADNGRIAAAIQRLEWAKENVRMLPYQIDEALAAARVAGEEVSK